jgi:hypothetical protein
MTDIPEGLTENPISHYVWIDGPSFALSRARYRDAQQWVLTPYRMCCALSG